MSYYFGKDATFTPDFFGGTTPEDTLFQTQPVEPFEPVGAVGKILICAGGTCQERRQDLFDLADETIKKRVASCSGKGIGDVCTPFVTEITRRPPRECERDEHCPEGEKCRSGRCQPELPKEEWILICAGGTCQERRKSIFDMGDSDVQKRIASCSGKAVGDKCTPFVEPPTDKSYIMCVQNVCQERTLTDREAEQLKGLIQRCSGKGIGDDCAPYVPPGPDGKTLACVGGTCIMVDASTPEKIAACSGLNEGDTCGTQVKCTSDADCPTNYHCVNGKCNPFTEPPKPGPSPEPEGCEGGYKNTTGESCPWNFESKGIGGVQWCCPKEAAEPLGEYKLPTNMQELLDALIARGKELLGKEVGFSEAQKAQMLDALPEEAIESLATRRRELLAMRPGYEPELEAALSSLATSLTAQREKIAGLRPGYTPETEARFAEIAQALTGRREEIAGIEPGYTPGTIAEMIGALPKELHGKLMGRGEELLDMPLGFTPESIARMFGLDFERIREREAGGRESLLGVLGQQGKLGTGVVPEQMGKLAWGTEQNVSDLQRELYVLNELQKREDLSRYTGMAGDIFGQGMEYTDLVGRTYGGIEEKEKRDVLDYTSAMLGIAPMEMAALREPEEKRKTDILDYTAAMLGIAPMEMAALTAPSERRKADVLDYTQAAAQIVPQEMAYARQMQDLLTSFKTMEKSDILDFSREAQNIFGTGAGAEQLTEMINAARRGESSQALSQLLALLGLLKY